LYFKKETLFLNYDGQIYLYEGRLFSVCLVYT